MTGLDANSQQCIWMKAKGRLPDDLSFHYAVVAFCSDHYLLNTTLLPHGLNRPGSLTILASIDHAIWFHEPFRADEWLLYFMETPRSNGGRGLAFGRIYTRDGRLVASTAQEGVIRVRDKPIEKL